jgi:hypothetical protein
VERLRRSGAWEPPNGAGRRVASDHARTTAQTSGVRERACLTARSGFGRQSRCSGNVPSQSQMTCHTFANGAPYRKWSRPWPVPVSSYARQSPELSIVPRPSSGGRWAE